MWFYRVLSSILFLYAIGALNEEVSSSSLPEEMIILKLKTAARLRENLGKVLSLLPARDYEMYNSIKLIKKYLRNGGSLVNSLEVLPSIAYLPIRDQLNEILLSMENYLPRYVLPAIGVIRRALNGLRRAIDVDDVFRPNYGPLKADLLYKIHAADLPVVAEETPLSSVERYSGEPKDLVGRALAMLLSGNAKHVGQLIAQILDNIKLKNDDPEVRESARHLVRVLSYSDKKLQNLTVTNDAYGTVKNAVIAVGGRREDMLAWESAQTLLPYLKKPEDYCTQDSKMERFFSGEVLNLSLLLSKEVGLKSSEAGRTLLKMMDSEDINVDQAFEEFHSMEYVEPIDLLIGSISHLRRYQNSRATPVEALEEIYAILLKKYRSNHWWKDRPRNTGRMKTILRGMIHENDSLRMRRLVEDIMATIDNGLLPGALKNAMAFVPSLQCHGPSCMAMKILQALNDSRGINDLSLRGSVTELLTTRREENEEEIDHCARALREEIDGEEIESLREESLQEDAINATDLLQAVQGLAAGSPSYILLRDFLEDRKELEKKLGEVIDIRAHPTRGRLLAWLFQKLAASEDLEEGIRKVAEDLVDRVSQDGYGAAGVESTHRLWISA